MVLVKTARRTLGEKPVMATPRAVPAAGGCSTSKATIRKMEIPTTKAYTMTAGITVKWVMRVAKDPDKRPTMWLQITLLGLAVTFLGMVNMIKAVAPIEAITTTCSMFRSNSTINNAIDASKL